MEETKTTSETQAPEKTHAGANAKTNSQTREAAKPAVAVKTETTKETESQQASQKKRELKEIKDQLLSTLAKNPTPHQTGKRKTAIARVRLTGGKGLITINGRRAEEYFKAPRFLKEIQLPFEVTNLMGAFNVVARLSGGGPSGQAGALKHAIAKAIDALDERYHKSLKQMKLLTRDSRKVERKLFGHKKARKSFQFSKR